MSEGVAGFRTAAFGGFRREDVLQYLESAAAQAKQRQEELMERLHAAEEDRDRERENAASMSEKNAELLERLGRMSQDADKQRRQAEEQETAGTLAAQEIESLHEELETLRTQVEQLKQECQALRDERDALAAKNEEYQAAKVHFADIELCAHQYAGQLEEKAKQQAAEVTAAAQAEAASMREEAARETEQLRRTASEEIDAARKQAERECAEQRSAAAAEAAALRAQADNYYEEKKAEIEQMKRAYRDMMRRSVALLDEKTDAGHVETVPVRQPDKPEHTHARPAEKSVHAVVTEMLDGRRK